MLKVRLCKDLGCESSDGIDNVFKLLVDCRCSHRVKPGHLRSEYLSIPLFARFAMHFELADSKLNASHTPMHRALADQKS